ncbi:MAG TPA: hypothetical protein PLL76_23860 [Thermoanaerobaculia bacterium]|jgi:hypothetical protein|nr:hypothetical protein [Thermoanaerobaculia bacterium]
MTWPRSAWIALLAVAAAQTALPALGQLSIDAPPSQRTLPAAEQVEQEIATARFRLGPLRVAPFLTLQNVGWTNNALVQSEGTVDDYTASVSAGARLVVPIGRKLFLRGTLAPTYDWYHRTTELRSFGGDYSGEALGLFNRLTVAGGGRYYRRIRSASSEVGRDVLNTTSRGFANAELELLKRLSLFGGIEQATSRLEDKALDTPGLSPVSDLDRTETAQRAGVRYAFSSALSFGVMGEEVRTRFERNGLVRDNDVQGLLFVVRYDRERFYVEGTAGIRKGTPVSPSDLYPEFRAGSYGYFVSYFVTRTLEMQVLGSRRPEAALFLDNPYFFETRNALTLRLAVGRRLSLHILGELGANRYVNPVQVVDTGEIVVRRDEATSFGGGFDFRVSRALSVGLTAMKDRWQSNVDFYDRETFRVMGGLSIAADFSREERR